MTVAEAIELLRRYPQGATCFLAGEIDVSPMRNHYGETTFNWDTPTQYLPKELWTKEMRDAFKRRKRK